MKEYILKMLNKFKNKKLKYIVIIISIFVVLLTTGIFIFAFPTGVERPTYCLTCKQDHVHLPDGILDYHEKYNFKHVVHAGFKILKNNQAYVETQQKTELRYATVGDTLTFRDFTDGATAYNFQYTTPSGAGNKVYKGISRSTFEGISLNLSEAGTYSFFLAVKKGDKDNWNGQHVVLG